MTNTPAAAGKGTPLWTKAKVEEWLSGHPAFGDPSYALVLASDIVYDYERELARLRAANAARVKELMAELGEANRKAMTSNEAWDEARRYHALMLEMEQELAALRAANAELARLLAERNAQ